MRQINMISVLDGYISASVTIYGKTTRVKIKDRPELTASQRDDRILKIASIKTIYEAMSHE